MHSFRRDPIPASLEVREDMHLFLTAGDACMVAITKMVVRALFAYNTNIIPYVQCILIVLGSVVIRGIIVTSRIELRKSTPQGTKKVTSSKYDSTTTRKGLSFLVPNILVMMERLVAVTTVSAGTHVPLFRTTKPA